MSFISFLSGTVSSDRSSVEVIGGTSGTSGVSPEVRKESFGVDRVFRRFAGNLFGRRYPEIFYQSAQKRGAFQFSTVCESLDAHRGVEHREWVFVRLQVPEGRKVGLAMEFLEDEPLCWRTDHL